MWIFKHSCHCYVNSLFCMLILLWENVDGGGAHDTEKTLTICICSEVCTWERERDRGSSRIHKYCIPLFDECLTHFHVSSTNSTVIFFLLSVIFQTAAPDNYPRETPDQNHLILSAAQLHHTLILHHSLFPLAQSLFDSSSADRNTHQFKCKNYIYKVFVSSIFHTFCNVCLLMLSTVITVLLQSDCWKASLCTVTKRLIHNFNRGGHCAFSLMLAALSDGLVSKIMVIMAWKKVLLKITFWIIVDWVYLFSNSQFSVNLICRI